jgi:hypothetical protein
MCFSGRLGAVVLSLLAWFKLCGKQVERDAVNWRRFRNVNVEARASAPASVVDRRAEPARDGQRPRQDSRTPRLSLSRGRYHNTHCLYHAHRILITFCSFRL